MRFRARFRAARFRAARFRALGLAALATTSVGVGVAAAQARLAREATSARHLAPADIEPVSNVRVASPLGPVRLGAPDDGVVGRFAPSDPSLYAGQTEERTLEASEDAYTASEHPGSNFGQDSRLQVGQRGGTGAMRTFIYWDLDELDPKEVVLGGDIHVHQRGGGPSGDAGRDVPMQRIKSGWKESEITWSNQPTEANGGVSGERLDTVHLGTSGGWRTWKADELVQKWYSGEWENQGVHLQGYEADGSYRDFDSNQTGDEPELELEIVFDDVPPVSAMVALPEFTNESPFLLEWTGQDPEPGAGIAFFTLWGRQAGSSWLVISDATDATSALFEGAENGKRYDFRVHATDFAGNIETPPEAPEATTLVDLSPPVTAVTPLPPFSPAEIVLRWAGEDYPQDPGTQNAGVQHYDVQISIAGGPWGDLALGVQATSLTFEGDNGVDYAFRVRAVDRAGNIEAYASETRTLVDTAAPSVWFNPTSGVDSPSFPVSWSGSDAGGSGVATYDVQYQVNGGLWQDWVTDTEETRRPFNGEYGNTYSFRARATDNLGNEGAYPNQPQLWVHAIRTEDFVAQNYLPRIYARQRAR